MLVNRTGSGTITVMANLDASSVQNINALAAIVITVLAGAVLFLFRYIQKLWEKISGIQDARLKDALDSSDKYAEVMKGFSQTAELLYNKLKGQ